MLYLLAAIVGSSSLVILLKMFDVKGVNTHVGITVNYIVGAVLSFIFAPVRLPVSEILSANWLWIAVVIGALFSLSFVVYALSAQRSGVAITTISGRAAVVIPVVFAFVVLNEQATMVKVAMLVLILLAMVLILKKDGPREENKIAASKWLILLPIVVFLFNGVNDTFVQYAQKAMIPSADLIPVFSATMFVAGAITGAITFVVSCRKHPHRPNGKDVLWGGLLGFMNWVCMFGVFYALDQIDGSVFYPLYYSGAIVMSTLVGVLAFREKLSRTNYIGIAIAIAAIAVLSMQ